MAPAHALARCSRSQSRARASGSSLRRIPSTSSHASGCSSFSTRGTGRHSCRQPNREAHGMARQRLVIVGNGMAGLRFLEEIIARAPRRFEITVIGAEPVAAYNRILLSALLAGEVAAADVVLRPRQWYEAHGIELITDQSAEALDCRARCVRLQDRRSLAFDSLVLATGSDPLRLPIPGSTLKGVATFRTLADSAAFEQFAASHRPAVVIGGGLLGIEAASALARRGVPVSLVHIADRLM